MAGCGWRPRYLARLEDRQNPMRDVVARSDCPKFGYQLRIEQGAGTDADDRRALGGRQRSCRGRRRASAWCCRARCRLAGGGTVQVASGADGCRVGAHVAVRTPLYRDLRQVVAPVMRVVGSLDIARGARTIGSESPSSTQIITGTVCTDFGSDLGALPASPGVQAVARSRTFRRGGDDRASCSGTIRQVGPSRVHTSQARTSPCLIRSSGAARCVDRVAHE